MVGRPAIHGRDGRLQHDPGYAVKPAAGCAVSDASREVMSVLPTPVAPTVVPVGSVPDGKVSDYLTGKLPTTHPEEYVRQNIEKSPCQAVQILS